MIPLLLLLVGCGPTEAQFQKRADREVCLWKQGCFGEDYDVCMEEAAAGYEPPSQCDYDRHAAKQCVKGLKRLDCPNDGDLFEHDVGMPPECAEVWDCG
ncbi:MAG: hypothetical protein H6742_13260 [Alphaproteobacteria bacterium]|nr:hypothetical protein [Alphaproteobacteria bacterium]